ncbi:MAG: 3-methyl-2-oxobutanoate hydroxymethyltransferase, partial [Desulfurococcaceae archaeon]
GQVLVITDVLGLTETPPPFAKAYADLRTIVVNAVRRYVEEVKNGAFPSREHYFYSKEQGY